MPSEVRILPSPPDLPEAHRLEYSNFMDVSVNDRDTAIGVNFFLQLTRKLNKMERVLIYLRPEKVSIEEYYTLAQVASYEKAGVAQLAEHQPSKLRVAGSIPVSRSIVSKLLC